jgi:WD40 repeat protein
MVATGGDDGIVRVTKLSKDLKSFDKGSTIELKGAQGTIFSVDISASGGQVIAASKDGNTYIFDIATR